MENEAMASRVLVLYAGGTIGMARAEDGFRPMTGFEDVLRRLLREQVAAVLPDFDVVALAEPIDSANLQPSHWSALARELVTRWQAYDGSWCCTVPTRWRTARRRCRSCCAAPTSR